MDIDWFTFAAQIVNFLVLVWLLKRFLYGPIMNAMDQRERDMAERAARVEAAEQDARKTAEEYRQKSVELEHAREDLLAQAGRETEEWKKQQLQQARESIEQSRKEWFRSVEMERDAFLRELRQRAGQQVFETARYILTRLSDAQLEERIVHSFLNQLKQIDDVTRKEISRAIQDGQPRVLVETAWALPADHQTTIRSSVSDILTNGAQLEFKTEPDLICGIELKAGGYKVAWSVQESLEELEEEFSKALDEATER